MAACGMDGWDPPLSTAGAAAASPVTAGARWASLPAAPHPSAPSPETSSRGCLSPVRPPRPQSLLFPFTGTTGTQRLCSHIPLGWG